MIFSDIITLAKAGYSPADVKDLIKLTEINEKETEQGTAQPVDDKDQIILDLKRQIEENEKKLQQPEPEPEPEPEKDPRDEEIEKLKKKLEAFQEAEKKKDISGLEGKKTDDDIVKDLVKSFM